jgi:glycosyltransferase involved in cell wall biosynthesis
MPLVACENYVILQYCYRTPGPTYLPPPEGADDAAWLPHWERAALVISYYDLPALSGRKGFNFLHTPLGVDGDVFRSTGEPRRALVLTSGTDPSGEAITECWEAARRAGLPAVHLGPEIQWGSGVDFRDGVSDEELASLYSRCWYVSGLRREEGFELPVLEGLACGARPVVFDRQETRRWFGQHAVFVPELPRDDLAKVLADVLVVPPKPVTDDERERAIKAFNWERICATIWERVLCARRSPS